MKRLIFIIMLLVFCSVSFTFAKTYDLSQISNVKLVSEYSEDITVDNMDTVTFGSYYQSNASNKEPIEWIVLDKQGDKYFLLSKYILDCKCYNNICKEVTWESCTLRNWLNTIFINQAFSGSEKNNIENTNVVNNDTIIAVSETVVSGGNNTKDKIFCLSTDEAKKYFNKSTQDKRFGTKGTSYALSVDNGGNHLQVLRNGQQIGGASGGGVWEFDSSTDWMKGNGQFWLRSPGGYEATAGFVSVEGALGGEESVNANHIGVRPALWLNLSSLCLQYSYGNNDNITNQTSATTTKGSTYGSSNVYDISNISKVKLVTEYDINTLVDNMDTVTFGSYYQSNSSSKEPIEWIVLDRQGNRALLLSKYILDHKRYDDTGNDVTWETCSLRNWLNTTFLNSAFDSSNKNVIETTNVINNDNSQFATKGGNNTNDKIFCLSIDEVIKYFYVPNIDSYDARRGADTPDNMRFATSGTNFAKSINIDGHKLSISKSKHNSWWDGKSYFMLRSPGYTQNSCIQVFGDGSFDFVGCFVDDGYGVRPALWINTTSLVKNQNDVANNTQVSLNTKNKNTIIESNSNKTNGSEIVEHTENNKGIGADELVVGTSVDLYNSLSTALPQPNSWYKNESGLWYYYESDGITPKKGWFIDNSDNQTYYFDPITGVMAVGWTKIGDKYYYFNESNNDVENLHETGDDVRNSNNGKVKGYGSMFRNETTPDGNFVNENGEWVDKLESTKVNSLNKYLVVFAALIIIIALICIIAIKFFANKDFKISINELMSNNKNMIAIIIVIVIVLIVIIIIMKNTIFVTKNVIKSDSGGKYYLDTNGNRVINDWFKYEDYYYYTDGNGYIETNKWVDKEYFVDKDGKMLINTWYVDNDNNKYYLGNDGKYYRNELYTIDGKEYYFDDSGKVITNITFVVPSNSYVSYFDNDGAMVKANDFVKVGDKELFINDKGRIVGNDWVSKDGNWYYLGANGEVLKNQWIDNTYYVDANGIMLKNTKTPDGSEVGSDGRILEKYNNNSVNDITGVIKNAKAVTPHTYNSDTSSNTIANSNKKYKNGVRVVVEGDWVNHNKKSKTIAGISQTDDITGCVGMLQGGKKDMMCLIGHKVGDIVEESGIDVFGKTWTAWYEILAIYDERPW